MDKLIGAIRSLKETVSSLEETVRQQRYALENLQTEIADLQAHALHGAFGAGKGTGNIDDPMVVPPSPTPLSYFY
jgi:hypothetical protein